MAKAASIPKSEADPQEPLGLIERLACKFCQELVEADPQVMAAHVAHCRHAPDAIRRYWRAHS